MFLAFSLAVAGLSFLSTSFSFYVPNLNRQSAIILHHRSVSPALAEDAPDISDIPGLKPSVPTASYEAMDIRVGRIVKAETVPDPDHGGKPSRKFLSIIVDIGLEKRCMVSAVRPLFDVEEAIGKSVLVVANTEEEVILGMPSRGRILTATNYSTEPMPRTLRNILLGGGPTPPGSSVTGI